MFIFPYTGGYSETNFRHAESLTELAPREYQDACLRAGGRNIYGQPNFRLAILQTRFQRMGGFRMNFYDAQGRYHRQEACEAFVPRYRQKKGFEDSFVLEVWRPAEWYAAQGFGSPRISDYSDTGQHIQRLESIPARGGYEAVIWDADIPWCFTPWRHIITINGQPHVQERAQPLTIEKAIHTWIAALDMSGKKRAELRKDNQERADESTRRIASQPSDRMSMFDMQPAMAMRGEKGAQRTGTELWREEKHREETT